MGVPKSGPCSIVVTDIEGYSDLMSGSPQLMGRVMTLHNAVMRKAAEQHAGKIVDMEGDSFTVAFHDAHDAAFFCLQVQQALMKVWSESEHTAGITADSRAQYTHTHCTQRGDQDSSGDKI